MQLTSELGISGQLSTTRYKIKDFCNNVFPFLFSNVNLIFYIVCQFIVRYKFVLEQWCDHLSHFPRTAQNSLKKSSFIKKKRRKKSSAGNPEIDTYKRRNLEVIKCYVNLNRIFSILIFLFLGFQHELIISGHWFTRIDLMNLQYQRTLTI